MSWWNPFGTSSEQQKKTSDGGVIAPSRTDRAQCYNSRDAFFRCLDKNNILDSVEDADQAAKVCGLEVKAFEENCATAWVKYFKQKRVVDFKKEEALRKFQEQGADIPPGLQPK